MILLFRSHAQLGNQPGKLAQDTTLFQNEKCIVKAHVGTLTLPILVDKEVSGYLMIGKGEFTLDAIIETSRGAVGKSLTQNLDRPFLMLGENKSFLQSLEPASPQDLSNRGFGSVDEFLKTANEAFDHFAHRPHGHVDVEHDACIFAFATEHDDKWDFLIAKDDKLVYTSRNKVYVSRSNGGSASVGSGEILVSRKGKTVVIERGNILVDRD